jgi:predicted RNA methylase
VKKPLGNKRVTGKEQYYTPTKLAGDLVETAATVIPDFSKRNFFEPAGGNGSFIKALQEFGAKNVSAVDLYPKHALVSQGDFLEHKSNQKDLVVISNPPFGRNNALAIPFFNHAADFSDYICFLVPRSWRKWSVQNRLDSRFHLLLDKDVFVSYEDDSGNAVRDNNDLRTCFQVWQKKEQLRPQVRVPDNGLITKTGPEDAELALRVFGYGCGSVLESFPREKNTTLMFLKTKNTKIKRLLPKLDFHRFSKNTAYTEALALPEINYLLNEAVFGSGFHQEKVR